MENNINEIKVIIVKKEYFKLQYEKNLKKNICVREEISDLVFKWSLETVRQFAKNLIETNSVNFYISHNSQLENIITKKEKIKKIIENFNKSKANKIDVFELVAILPFLVEANFTNAILCSMTLFCFESEENFIKAFEFGIFIDSFFRSVANNLLIEEQIVEDCFSNVIKLDYQEIEKDMNLIFDKNSYEDQELPVNYVLEYQ